MSLIHEVYLVKLEDHKVLRTEDLYNELLSEKGNSNYEIIDKIEFSDDVFGYLEDILNWLPISVPMFPEVIKDRGIKRYGISILDIEAYIPLYNIINGLIQILSVAQEDIKLTGDYVFDSAGDGVYQTIVGKKPHILNEFIKIKEMIEYLKKDKYYVVHFGI